jgi:glycosyltransferase involved in cell wall biosynthesis
VVVDNFSSDETPQIAEELADIVIATGPERSAQRNAGARATSASIVGFVDSDMIPAPEVVAQAVVAIRAGATAVIVPERTVGIGYWARVRAFERSFYDGSDDIEAASFFSGTEPPENVQTPVRPAMRCVITPYSPQARISTSSKRRGFSPVRPSMRPEALTSS